MYFRIANKEIYKDNWQVHLLMKKSIFSKNQRTKEEKKMDTILAAILGISALVVIVLTLGNSIARTKSSVKWLKGYNLKRYMSTEAVVDLLNRTKYPEKESVVLGEDGSVVYKTKLYSYPVEIAEDKNGCTTVGLIVNWGRMSKSKRKKVALDWDNIYQFLQQEVEGTEVIDAMQAYNKNLKMQKILKIASVVCVISAVVFLLVA